MRKYIPLVLFIFSWPVLSADIHGRVVRVLDGDTIEVMDSRKAVRIRLVNIDAPEKKQDYGRWSTDMMKSLVAGKTVTVTYFQRDRYGRILGQVYAPDGMNINQFMVRAGAAWVYEQYNILATSEDAADRKGSQFYERTVQNCGYEAVVSVSAGTGRGYRPAEREYPATITPVVAVIQDGVSVAC